MNISIQTVHFDADKKLLAFVQKKLDKLETFHDRITKVEVYMNHSRTISDAKSWLTSAGYRHVIRNPSGMISMDLIMSNHCRHYLR